MAYVSPPVDARPIVCYGGPSDSMRMAVPYNMTWFSMGYPNKEKMDFLGSYDILTSYSTMKTGKYEAYFYSGMPLMEYGCHVFKWETVDHDMVMQMWYERNGWETNPFTSLEHKTPFKPKPVPGKDCLF